MRGGENREARKEACDGRGQGEDKVGLGTRGGKGVKRGKHQAREGGT